MKHLAFLDQYTSENDDFPLLAKQLSLICMQGKVNTEHPLSTLDYLIEQMCLISNNKACKARNDYRTALYFIVLSSISEYDYYALNSLLKHDDRLSSIDAANQSFIFKQVLSRVQILFMPDDKNDYIREYNQLDMTRIFCEYTFSTDLTLLPAQRSEEFLALYSEASQEPLLKKRSKYQQQTCESNYFLFSLLIKTQDPSTFDTLLTHTKRLGKLDYILSIARTLAVSSGGSNARMLKELNNLSAIFPLWERIALPLCTSDESEIGKHFYLLISALPEPDTNLFEQYIASMTGGGSSVTIWMREIKKLQGHTIEALVKNIPCNDKEHAKIALSFIFNHHDISIFDLLKYSNDEKKSELLLHIFEGL